MKLPLFPTLIVAAAVATLIALGIWQLDRSEQKEALRAQYARNAELPAMAFTPAAVADEALLFRRATAYCLEVASWRKIGGRSASGKSGTRLIAQCRTGAEGPGFAADMGVSQDSKAAPVWKGGEVSGRIVAEPSQAGLWARLTRRGPPPRPMIVSFRPAPGLEASRQPSGDIANNSFGYAFQWFFFAALAALIYVLALRSRRARRLPG